MRVELIEASFHKKLPPCIVGEAVNIELPPGQISVEFTVTTGIGFTVTTPEASKLLQPVKV